MTVLFFENKPKHDMLVTAGWWTLAFVLLGIAFGASISLQNYGFAVASQRLVARVRLMAYRAMLRQEIGWLDLDENSSGALTTRLATDTATLQAFTSDMLNQMLVSITALAVGFGIALYYSWRMTLILLAVVPVFIFSNYVGAQAVLGYGKSTNDADAAAGSLLSESIGAIRTVASFGMEEKLHKAYVGYLSASNSAVRSAGVKAGGAFGLSQGVTFFNMAFLFYMGGKWWLDGILTFEQMYMVLMVIMLSTFPISMNAQTAADQGKAKIAAQAIFKVVDRVPEIDSTSTEGETISELRGRIHFRQVDFAYPSRPAAQIYNQYDLTIHPGQTVALVGASGSGKSTAIALLERFYDPIDGSVTLDGTDLRKLQLPWLRERISLVSQEPVLFAGTIAENIAMGKPGATREDIEDATKKANAFDFISNFPSGFETQVGDRGVQLSGGQKQRIAIARAILRDPNVLLLDEATSALDNESERVVQESLDRLLAQKKRTTIIVAHRLTTIRNADLIAVTQDGAIIEQGTHTQLMAKPDGVYKALVARQMAAA